MCTSARFSLTGSFFHLRPEIPQAQINCGNYTHDIVDRSTDSGLAGLEQTLHDYTRNK